MAKQYLFVGGYADGTLREVPDGVDEWEIMEPTKLPEFEAEKIRKDQIEPQIATYARREWSAYGHDFVVFGLGSMGPNQIIDRLILNYPKAVKD